MSREPTPARTAACLAACEGIATEHLEGCFTRTQQAIRALVQDLERYDGRTLTRQAILARLKEIEGGVSKVPA